MWLRIPKLAFLISVTVTLTSAKPIDTEDDVRDYLRTYFMAPDYINPDFGQIQTEIELEKTLSGYQQFMGLHVTGQIDDETKAMMEKPRCGVYDLYTNMDDVKRKKRYATSGQRWNNNSPLTWRFQSTTNDLDYRTTLGIFQKSFKYWSDVANLEFRMITSGTPDIWVQFASREHGDGARSAFDGPGNTLAHAYFPISDPIGGDAHFDEDETWTDRRNNGINLLQVVVHELGHSLGLRHSSERAAVMYPSYLGYNPDFALGTDDIEGIQYIYGPKIEANTPRPTPAPTPRPTPAPTPRPTAAPTQATRTARVTTPAPRTTISIAATTTTTTTSRPDTGLKGQFCQNLHFDAITTFGNKTYAFKDDLYIELDRYGRLVSGFPKYISDGWTGLQGIRNIDAALYWDNRTPKRIYLFKDNLYWRYEMNSQGDPALRTGYPRRIVNGFPGLPNNIDNAFVWSGNGRSYIFKGNQYYRLRQSGNQTRGNVDNGYPKPASVWKLPETSYDAAFQWVNRRTYFYKDSQYIRLNDQTLGVDRVNARYPSYPRTIDRWWINCDSGSLVDGVTETPMEVDEPNEDIPVIEQQDDNDGDDDGDSPTHGQDSTSFSTYPDIIDSAQSIRQWAAPVVLLVITALVL